MKNEILKKSGEIFLKFGFKSTTMDDIANQMAISKKTIYKYFKNKEQLVDESISFFHNAIHSEVSVVCNKGYNAIEENFEIKKMFKDLLQNSGESPMFQLQKYYPKTYHNVMKNEFALFKDCISQNIEKGIIEKLYRNNLDISITTRLYFTLVYGIHDANLFPLENKTLNQLEIDALEYHTRAIATKKGIAVLENQLEKFN
jgi:AcrR family transcriptional regulator